MTEIVQVFKTKRFMEIIKMDDFEDRNYRFVHFQII